MAFLVNMGAFDRGYKLIDDMEREAREDAIRKKDDARQAEKDARDRTRFDQEQSDRKTKEAASSALLDSIKQAPVTTGMKDFFDRRAPQVEADASAAQPPADVASNPAQNNVVAQQPAGSFTGDPRMVQRAIMGLKDPVERERAMQAFRLQMNDPAKNAELLMANRADPVQAPAQPVAVPSQAEPVQKPMATMASTMAPKPFELPPQVLARRNAMVAEAEYAAKVNPSALPAIQERINKFDMGARASAVQAHVMSMDQRSFDALVARADTNPQFEAKAASDGNGGTVLTIGEKQVKLSRSQAADWLTGLYLMEQGDVDGGRMMIASVNKELAEVSGKHIDWNLKARAEARQEAQLGINQSAEARAATASADAHTQAGLTQQKTQLELEQLQRTGKLSPQAVHAAKTLEMLDKAIADAQGREGYNPEGAGVKLLQERRAKAAKEWLDALRGPASTAAAAPPLSALDGKYSGGQSPQSNQAAQPADQPAVPSGSKTGQSSAATAGDNVKIYNDALARMGAAAQSADTPEAKARAQSDELRMRQEMGRLSIPVATMAQTMSPTRQAEPAQATPVMTMAQAMPDPLRGRSPSEIRAIAQQLNTERNRWAGNPAAAKRVAEIDALLSRINNGQY